MLDRIEQLDVELMLYLNGVHNEFFDVIMFYGTKPLTWIPLYLFILYLIHKKIGLKGMFIFLIAVGLTTLLCDRISVMAFKDVFQRFRPCHNGDIGELIHIVNDKCGGRFSFVSSHATNFFGLATLFAAVLRKDYKWIVLPLFLWAAFISYTRVYLGVHYPADITCGAILGTTIGLITYQVFRKLYTRYGLDT